MTDTGIVKTIRCEGCGRTLKPAALFCTACGTRREIDPGPAHGRDCASCGSALRPGADFCTECGAKASSGLIDLDAASKTEAPAPPAPADRVSPAASRAILGSVSGGMGSYVGKSSTSTGAPPPPALPADGDAEGDHHRRNVAIIAVVAAVLLLIGGIAVAVATQRSSDGSLKAGQGSRRSSDVSFASGHTADASTSSSAGSSKSPGSKTGSTTQATSRSGSSKPGSKTSSTSRSTSSASITSSPSKGKTSGTNAPAQTPHAAPPKTTSPPAPVVAPAKLAVSSSQISVSGDGGGWVTVRNAGGKSMNWNIGSGSMNNGSLGFSPSSGTLGGGSSVAVKVNWSGGIEGVGSGSFRVNATGTSQKVSVSGNSNKADSINDVRASGCSGTCPSGSYITVQINLKAQGDFKPAGPSHIYFKIVNGSNPFVTDDTWSMIPNGDKKIINNGTLAQARVKVLNNSFVPNSTSIEIWTMDAAGNVSGHETRKIFG